MKFSWLRKILLLCWKNFIITKRQYIVTALEIVLPTLFICLLAYLRSQVDRFDQGSDYDYPGNGPGEEYRPEHDEQYLLDYLRPSSSKTIVGFTPNGGDESKIINNILERACPIISSCDRARFIPRGFNSEEAMETFQSALSFDDSYGGTDKETFAFGIVFEDLQSSRVSYKIRMEGFSDTNTLLQDDLFGGFYGGLSNYVYTGFLAVQLLMDKELVKFKTQNDPTYTFSIQSFPKVESKSFGLEDLYNIFLPIFIVTGFVFVVPSVVRGVVSEKETGVKELLKMTGLPDSIHWLGWMLTSTAVLVVTVTIIVIVLFVPFKSSAGAVFVNSDPTLMWVVLMLYSIWATTYCFLISSCFEKPTIATTIGIVIWLVSFYGLGFQMEIGFAKSWSNGLKIFLCLLPNVGISLALSVICKFEALGRGSTWGNIGDSISSVNSMTLLYPVLMLIASSVLNMLLCMYLEAILPKKFGIRKPFYFIFQPSEWGFGKKVLGSSEQSLRKEDNPGIESDPVNINAKVEIKNLRKEFHGNVAVDNLSLKMFPGQIFCLLGENGAGKTTTMSILTGIFPPSSGTAIINGNDIATDMTTIRENMGLCPQHNMLFDKLTVLEQLKFFGMLRGLSSKEAEKESNDLLASLHINEKTHKLGANLSGGQKRRLSLGCSIIGGSQVLFLDEPTSGLDPEARRVIWDLLLRLRENRVICLTTHFMEEADVLGDRIAILAKGKLQCCGSPGFLKEFYGAGYALSVVIKRFGRREDILKCVQKHIPGAYFQMSHSNATSELSIVLPSHSGITSLFPRMFLELRERQRDLGIDKVGVGWTTMDDVFVRAEKQSHKEDDSEVLDETTNTNHIKRDQRLLGFSLAFSQLYGLIVKKMLWSLRRKRITLTQILIPLVLTIITVAISRSQYSVSDRTPPLKMTLSSYKNPITLYRSHTNEKTLAESYASVVGSSAKRITTDLSDYLRNIGDQDLASYREKYIVAAEFNATHAKAMYSYLALHSAPLSMNLITNAWLQSRGRQERIEVINHPFANNMYQLLKPADIYERQDTTMVSYVFSVLIPIGMILLVGSFLVMPTEERLCQGKQLQLMTGVNPMLYWASTFICDMIVMVITICLMTVFLPIVEKDKMFTNYNGAGVFVLYLSVFSIATLSFTYIFATFVRTVAGGFALVTIIHLVTGIGLGIASVTLETFKPGTAITVSIIGRFFPSFGLVRGSAKFADIAAKNSRCSALSQKAIDILCSPQFANSYYDSRRYTQDCCDNCYELGDRVCFQPEPFFRWSKTVQDDKGKFHKVPEFTQDIVWQAVIGVAYFVLLVLIEYDVFAMILEFVLKQKASIFQRTVTDTDVIEENQRVDKLVNENRTSEDALVVHNLCKSYGTFSAVSSLSFGVHHGECFGLLGVNGAGKTTTFRMLTGDENRSNGNSYLNNLGLVNGRKDYLANIGYCPQFDGIVGVLTGREMLQLFARLRGLPSAETNESSKLWLTRTGLLRSADVQSQKYSGGMKRRLTAAMALIGDPPVIFFDEPTSGVDPVARRQFWKIISSVRDSGQAVILTSHSMEECEALCSRLGIMVNGEMQCLGGVQHLKNKFAQGYSLFLKFKQEYYQNVEMVNKVIAETLNVFHPCTVKDHHQATMKFQIHFQETPWNELYDRMEWVKQNNVCVEEYAITETTLEEVFLSFARTQYVNQRVTTGGNIFTRCF